MDSTIDLREYILSDTVSPDSEEFLPFQAALRLLDTTSATLKQKIKTGEIRQKHFTLTDCPGKVFLGVQIGSVKKLLVEKDQQISAIKTFVMAMACQHQMTSYSDVLNAAGLSWQSPPARKFCSVVLNMLNLNSYHTTLSSPLPCLISAIVVNRNTHIPTAHFFNQAQSLGLLAYNASKEDEFNFWEQQKRRVFEVYGDNTHAG